MELQIIQKKIFEIRKQKVMLDFDLAELYEVETRVLKQAVKRNLDLFPVDFLFELRPKEVEQVVSQFVIPSKSYLGGALPFAFTEHGVTMLANVLKSKKARQRSVAIVRAFIALKQFAFNYKDLADKMAKLEKKYNRQFADIYEALDLLLEEKQIEKQKQDDWKSRRQIGYK